MSFMAVIDSDKHKLIWSKSIVSLAAISDHIKVTIHHDTLSILAVNNAKTTHAEITFKKSFFHEFIITFENVMSEGFHEEKNDAKKSCYSFLINSRHLSVLFKNLDASDLEYICLKINWLKNCPITMKYKLLVEIRTKKLIIKKYQTSYQPIHMSKLDVSIIYKQELLEQEKINRANPESLCHEITYLMIEQIIPKQFLDMIPSSTEDFKIDIKNGKILFSGYTRQVLKDKEYLKQPMSVTVTLNLNELLNSNLLDNPNEFAETSINFRLKDFKNFMNLVTSLNTIGSNKNHGDFNQTGDEREGYPQSNNFADDASFEIYFKSPGDPILFELQNNSHVLIQFVQITSDNPSEALPARDEPNSTATTTTFKKPKFVLPTHVAHKVQPNTRPTTPNVPSEEALRNAVSFSSRKRLAAFKPTTRNSNFNSSTRKDPESRASSQMSEQQFDFNIPSSMESHEEVVTYGRRSASPLPDIVLPATKRLKHETNVKNHYTGLVNIDEKLINEQPSNETNSAGLANQDTDYSESDLDKEAHKENHDAEFDQAYLGPTQISDKPKSLFD